VGASFDRTRGKTLGETLVGLAISRGAFPGQKLAKRKFFRGKLLARRRGRRRECLGPGFFSGPIFFFWASFLRLILFRLIGGLRAIFFFWAIGWFRRSGCLGHRYGLRRGTKLRQNGLLLNLAFAQGGKIIGERLLFVEPDMAGVGANETAVEDAAGKLIEALFFERAQHAGADLGGVGDGIEGDAALLALLAKFVSERSHAEPGRADEFAPASVTGIIIGQGGGQR
jgi:hypothetical protein